MFTNLREYSLGETGSRTGWNKERDKTKFHTCHAGPWAKTKNIEPVGISVSYDLCISDIVRRILI